MIVRHRRILTDCQFRASFRKYKYLKVFRVQVVAGEREVACGALLAAGARTPRCPEQEEAMRRAGHIPALTLLLGLSLGAPHAARAQNASASWQSTPASILKNALRNVVAAQDRYRATHPVFATSIEVLQVPAESDVRLQILGATPNGWRARATHRARPGRSCVIFVGQVSGLELPKTDGDGEMAGEERVPLCDRME
jgi:hypothetical protein